MDAQKMSLQRPMFTLKQSIFLCLALTLILAYLLAANSNSERILLLSLEHPGIDKLAHYFLHMGVVSLLYIIGCKLCFTVGKHQILMGAFVLSLLLGILDEFQQLLVANRTFDIQDLLANFLGALTVSILILTSTQPRKWLFMILALPVITIGFLYQQANVNELHYKAGLIQMRQGDYLQARESFLKAVQQGQRFPALYNELAWVELEFLDTSPEIAIEHSYQAIILEPENADYLHTYGWALYKGKEYQNALNTLLHSYSLKPTDYCINYHLGVVYLAMKNNASALHHFQLQLDLNKADKLADKTRKMIATITIASVL